LIKGHDQETTQTSPEWGPKSPPDVEDTDLLETLPPGLRHRVLNQIDPHNHSDRIKVPGRLYRRLTLQVMVVTFPMLFAFFGLFTIILTLPSYYLMRTCIRWIMKTIDEIHQYSDPGIRIKGSQ
jgi:hypothetical protein